jgi:hypothetical protein
MSAIDLSHIGKEEDGKKVVLMNVIGSVRKNPGDPIFNTLAVEMRKPLFHRSALSMSHKNDRFSA